MTHLLQTAIKEAQKLSDQDQDGVAALILNVVAKKSGKRPLGLAKGLGHVHNDFNDPLSEEELADWYEGHPDDPLTKPQ